MRNSRKKGQMEIMGLIVIVILLTLGMFFVVSFKTQKPKVDVKKSFEQDQLASNFIIAFLKTNTECSYTIEKMVQDCAIEKRLVCRGSQSCTYIEQSAGIILEETFEKWGKNYTFTIEGLPSTIQFDACNPNSDRDSAFQPISLYPYPGTVVIKLDICES